MKNSILSPDPTNWQKGQVFEATDNQGQTQRYILERILGGGLTSVVWQVIHNEHIAALKVLRPVEDPKIINAFETEIQVLNEIKAFYEDQNLQDRMPVPKLYQYSPKGSLPAYMLMEYVSGKEVAALVGRRSKLPTQLKELRIDTEDLRNRIDEFHSDVFAETGLSSEARNTAADLVELAKQISGKLPQLVFDVETWASQQEGLSEEEILAIGLQTAQVFQVLHQATHRSYKDFQLKNFYFERMSKNKKNNTFKIIDWNVVSDEYDLQVESDLFNLANSLYYLITLITPEKGAPPDELEKWGGPAWTNDVSYALRLVLQRALSPKDADRYQSAYNWQQPIDSLKPLSVCQTIGEALEMVEWYRRADSADLIGLVNDCMEMQLFQDAQAAWEWARRNLEHLGVERRIGIEKSLSDIEVRLDQHKLPANELLQKCIWWLDASDIEQAKLVIQHAFHQAPDNLAVRRWNALIQAASNLTHEQFTRFWKEEKAINVLRAIEQKSWERAELYLNKLTIPITQLIEDVNINQILEQSEQYFNRIVNYARSDLSESLESNCKDIEMHTDERRPEYVDLILKEWPQYNNWLSEVQRLRTRKDILEEVLQCLKDGNPSEAVEILKTGIKNANTTSLRMRMQGLLRFSQNWLRIEAAIYEGWNITKSEWSVILTCPDNIPQEAYEKFKDTCRRWLTQVAFVQGYIGDEADVVINWLETGG